MPYVDAFGLKFRKLADTNQYLSDALSLLIESCEHTTRLEGFGTVGTYTNGRNA